MSEKLLEVARKLRLVPHPCTCGGEGAADRHAEFCAYRIVEESANLFATASQPQPERLSMVGAELINAANEVLTNGEWTDGEQRGEWKISKEVYETLRDATASPPVQTLQGEE